MRAHAKLSDQQHAKVIAMAYSGSTHNEISDALHLPKHQIGEVVTGWTKANLNELQRELRAFIEANLAAGTYSMILPPSSKLVRLPVLAEYAERWIVTSKLVLSCTRYQFSPRTAAAPLAAPLKCRHCKKRPRVSRRLECATCIKIVRRFANEVTPCS